MKKSSGGSLKMHTSIYPDGVQPLAVSEEKSKRKSKTGAALRRESFPERLMKNTAVSCALLLGIMALKNIHTPFTDSVTGAIRRVVSMDLKIDESIGKLSFVQKLMPESALVFLNMSSGVQSAVPAAGEIFHAYTGDQPWTEIKTTDNAQIRSFLSGTVTACVQTDHGDYTVLIQSEDGSEAVYAYLFEPLVKTGDSVEKASPIGVSGTGEKARLYIEYRVHGKSEDPAELIKVF